ncbi:5-formyltetrahydrofolate cyclo-ligase [Candidatus Sumerlaeota bacterium]|nr:5-formyltetrahydrofolate cyclo-ligase [Candidatus Sumerlaeota bacterium]MBI3735632.1 5-formyltetrahydrofolate cyclo-ligase [Candidatus Sumerlaeota bacterium]
MVDSAKSILRKEMVARRAQADPAWRAEASRRIAALALDYPAIARAARVSIFVSRGAEVDTTPLLASLLASKRTIAVPRVGSEDRLEMREANAFPQGFVPGAFGILEPDLAVYPRVMTLAELDAIILPGLLFDHSGRRIGYGKGHYDRFLAGGASAVKIGLAFSFQVRPELPQEEHDVRLDALVTEEGILEFGPK